MDIKDRILFSTWLTRGKTKQPLYQQLAHHLKEKIISGDIQKGYIFPPLRKLSVFFEVSRGIVAISLDMLVAEGLVIQNNSKRFIVADHVTSSKISNVNWRHHISRANHTTEKKIITQPREIFIRDDLKSNSYLVNEHEFGIKPIYVNTIKKVAEKICLTNKLQSKGKPELREFISLYLREKRGIDVTPSQILIVQTGHYSMYLMFMGLLSSNSTLITTTPNRFIMNSILEIIRAKVEFVSVDDEGMIIDDLYSKIRTAHNPVLYIEPNCSFALGLTTSEARKKDILNLCMRKGVPIVEADYLQEYGMKQLPTIKSYDTSNSVLYQSSFGTLLSYQESISFIVGSEYIIDHLTHVHSQIAQHCTSMSQLIYLELLESGVYDNMLENLRPRLHQRLCETDKLLLQYISPFATWKKRDGNIFIAVTFKAPIKSHKLNAFTGNCNWYDLPDIENSILIVTPSCTLTELEEFIANLAIECEKQCASS